MKRLCFGRAGLWAVVVLVVGVAAALLAGSAGAARTALPTLNIALSGAKGVSVSGSMRSGAVNVTSTFSGKLPRGSMGADFGLVQLRPGVTLAEAQRAGQRSNDLNVLTPYASIVVDASAPGTVQTVLTPGTWVALNLTGNGQPGVMPFNVTKSSSPAAHSIRRNFCNSQASGRRRISSRMPSRCATRCLAWAPIFRIISL